MPGPPATQSEFGWRFSQGGGGDIVLTQQDADNKLRIWLEGDNFPRIVFDPQTSPGSVLVGSGAIAPSPLAGGGGGSTVAVQVGDTTVTALATTLDFNSSDFGVSESPTGEANISILTGITRDTELTAGMSSTLTSAQSYADAAVATHAASGTAHPAASIVGLDERIRDTIGTALLEGTGIDVTVNDAGDTITVAVTGVDAEAVQDVIGAALTVGSGLTKTYSDVGNTIDISFTADMATQSELDAAIATRAAVSHAHAASATTSGTFDSARLATGTASEGFVPTIVSGVVTWMAQAPAVPLAERGVLALDGFAGATDDIKLTAAENFVKAQIALSPSAGTSRGFTAAIGFGNRSYTFASNGRAPFVGLTLVGPSFETSHGADSSSLANRTHEINLTFDSTSSGTGWYHNTGAQIRSVTMSNLIFVDTSGVGGSHPSVLTQSGASGGYQCLHMHQIESSGSWSVVGTRAQKVLVTACDFTGFWNINNGWNTQIHVGGSDCNFWMDGRLLIDSPGETAVQDGGINHHPGTADTYHIFFDFVDKTNVGSIYATCQGSWGAIRVDGQSYNSGSTSGNSGPVTFYGLIAEGRNRNRPCYGAVFTVDGGMAVLYSPSISYACTNPGIAASTGGDAAIVVTDGYLYVDGGMFQPAGTKTTADDDGGGTDVTIPVTDRSGFPQSGSFPIRVGALKRTVTSGHGTGAGTFTISAAATWNSGDRVVVDSSVAYISAAGDAVVRVSNITVGSLAGQWPATDLVPEVLDNTSGTGSVTADSTVSVI